MCQDAFPFLALPLPFWLHFSLHLFIFASFTQSPCKSQDLLADVLQAVATLSIHATSKKEHKRRKSVTVGLVFTLLWPSRAPYLGQQPPAACWEWCALLCVSLWGPRDVFLSAQPSLFFHYFLFSPLLYIYLLSPIISCLCSFFKEKKIKKSSGVTKLHVVCRSLFLQAQRHCGRNDNLLKKKSKINQKNRREREEKRHRACYFVLQTLHQTVNTH